MPFALSAVVLKPATPRNNWAMLKKQHCIRDTIGNSVFDKPKLIFASCRVGCFPFDRDKSQARTPECSPPRSRALR